MAKNKHLWKVVNTNRNGEGYLKPQICFINEFEVNGNISMNYLWKFISNSPKEPTSTNHNFKQMFEELMIYSKAVLRDIKSLEGKTMFCS